MQLGFRTMTIKFDVINQQYNTRKICLYTARSINSEGKAGFMFHVEFSSGFNNANFKKI